MKFAFLLVAILTIVLVYRAFNFTPINHSVDKVAALPLDYAQAAERLAGALRFKTISQQNPQDRDTKPFIDLHQYLYDTYPLVHQQLDLVKINQLSLLYHWKARNSSNRAASNGSGKNNPNKKPIMIMAHMDVVPVDQSSVNDWSFPPFEGVVNNGNIWGRGSLDDKGAVLAILESVEYLLSKGFQPNRDIYFSFGHDEEIGGSEGAAKVAEYIKSKGINFEYVLDEGGFVTEKMLPGIDLPIGFIGVAEKGYVSVKLSVKSEGGHSSSPPENTSIGILSRAIVNLEENPFKSRLESTTASMLATVGRNMSFGKRVVFANLWLFEPFLLEQLSNSKLTNASIRTTIAATVFHAGDKENALPINATAIINLRLLPGDSVEKVKSHITQAINDKRVKIEIIRGSKATPVSSITSEFYQQLSEVIERVSPEQGLLIAPNLLIAGTDSSHFIDLAENVYRFNGVKINPESFSGFHGTNEYLPVKEYQRAINFYYQIIMLNQ